MLSSFLVAAIPMTVLLAAAVYIYNRMSQTESGPQTYTPSSSWTRTSAQDSGIRRRNHPRHQMPASHLHETHLSSNLPDSGLIEEDHCEICFENVPCVRLYPCKHADICIDCVNKIVTTSERLCPFCRTRIHGYEEAVIG